MVDVLALLVFKVMMIRAQHLGLSMDALFEELADAEEVILVYSTDSAVHTIAEYSDVQARLIDALGLRAMNR